MPAVKPVKFTDVVAVFPLCRGDPDPQEPEVRISQSYEVAVPLAVQLIVAVVCVIEEDVNPDGATHEGGVKVYVPPLLRPVFVLIALLAVTEETVAGLPGVTLLNEVRSFNPMEAVVEVKAFTVPYSIFTTLVVSNNVTLNVAVGFVELPPPPI